MNCRLALVNAFDYAAALKMVAVTDKVSGGSPLRGAVPSGVLGYDETLPTVKRDLGQEISGAVQVQAERYNT